MKFTTAQINNIKLSAAATFSDNDNEGELNFYIISAALSLAFHDGMKELFGDSMTAYDDVPHIDQFNLKNDMIDSASWINGRTFRDSESELNKIMADAIETVNNQFSELTT